VGQLRETLLVYTGSVTAGAKGDHRRYDCYAWSTSRMRLTFLHEVA
jgi:hypothetical protein